METAAFTFDDVSVSPDRQIGLHSHSQWELSYVLQGEGTRTIGDLTEPITKGEIILIPPHIPHVWQFDPGKTDANGNIANLSVFFEPKTLERLAIAIPEFAGVSGKISAQTGAVKYSGGTYRRILEILLTMRGMTADARLPGMMDLLLALANAKECKKVGGNTILTRAGQRLEAVRVYCRCNYGRNITLDEVSAMVGMNRSSFCTFMRRHAGTSLTEFVNEVRLEKAVEMLCHTDNPIASIAYDVGFSSVAYFNRVFRARYKCTPKAMRRGLCHGN